MSTKIDGPRLSPLSGGPAKQLVVFLHGYGADGNDLIDIGRHWQQALPDASFVSPNAPEACSMNPFGRQWFGLQRIDANEKWEGVQKAGPELNEFLDDELSTHGLTESDLALVGFSQGTMMSLHVGLRREKPLAGIVGFSGALAGPEHLAGQIVSKPPILLVHGAVDDVIPVVALAEAQSALEKEDVSVNTHISEGLGHGIDGEGLMLGVTFLRQRFGLGEV